MAFMCAVPQASLKAATSSYRAFHSPLKTWARVMTMSISLAPDEGVVDADRAGGEV
jgi:hypothetical protein